MFREIILPVSIMALLASMLVPMPPAVMDFLLVSNLILALILLCSTLYIPEPLNLSSLPTILLLATLYRLALNISTTRLILSGGDAGQAVEAFGNVVIQGNIVVGAVVFLVITLVQFIVIAKGSERVAEVSARFTLDAMPGRQMSIDADVRAGLIDFETARKKRQELQTESRFYGALDGSMKFVKGDAIAGIIITLVNICGGLTVGLLMEGLTFGQAVSRYSILTVGEGLLSQIPALLNALAAGLVVTRVSKGDGKSVAAEVLSQFGQVRTVKLLIAGLSLVIACLPGIPSLAFLLPAAVLFISAGLNKGKEGIGDRPEAAAFNPRIPALLQVAITKDLASRIAGVRNLNDYFDGARQRVYESHGLLLARPDIVPLTAEGTGFQINIRGVRAYSAQSESASGEELLTALCSALESVITRRLPELIDDIQTRRLLDFIDKDAPELVAAVVPGVVTVTQLTCLLKSLSAEGISIKNFDLILQAVAEKGGGVTSERALLEEVRIMLRRIISSSVSQPGGVLRAYLLDPVLDLVFARAEKERQLIDLDCLETIVTALREQSGDSRPVIVCSRSARLMLRECLLARDTDALVLAHEEITEDVVLETAGRISAGDHEEGKRILETLAA